MSLIDDDFKKDENFNKCLVCQTKLEHNSLVRLCQTCFNKDANNSMIQIKNNINQYQSMQKDIIKNINKIKKDIDEKKIELAMEHKIEIDLINLDGLYRKLEIDIEINNKAFDLAQEYANKIRKGLGWKEEKKRKIEDI